MERVGSLTRSWTTKIMSWMEPMKLRGVSKIVDANTEIFEMYGTGEKVKNEDGVPYTRKP
jgi:hypothetical protein